MTRPFPAAAVLLALAPAAFCQTAAAPTFEVASIRPSQGGYGYEVKSHGPRELIQVSPDTLTMRNVSVRSCIRWAYHVMDYQVSGPDSIVRDRYEIVAKAPAAVTEDQLRTMMQTLLVDRFKLALHRQVKEVSGYVLVVGKGGPKFQESKAEGESRIEPDPKRMMVTVERTPVSQLVDMLSNIFRAPVIDETGLKGKYDISINVAKYMAEIGHGGNERPAGDAP